MESSILVNVKVVWTGQNLTSDMALQLYSGSTVDIPRWGSHRTFTHQEYSYLVSETFYN